jgi:predicted lipid-binding transport protein (Tim44 family)
MKSTIFKVIVLMMFSVCLLNLNDANAKRMGGGSSFGKQSNTVTKNQNSLPPKPEAPPVSAAPKPATPPSAAPAPTPSRFGGMGGILGGIAAGIGLSYLFSHMGIGEGMGSMLSSILIFGLLLVAGLWLIKKFAMRNMNTINMSTSSAGGPSLNVNSQAENQSYSNAASSVNSPVRGLSQQLPLIPEVSANTINAPIHADLTPQAFTDKNVFLENAKILFMQLQEASDQQNLEVLKEYTTPELFAFLRKDMLARESAMSSTQVLTLAADLLAVENENNEYLASVRFSGSIREQVNGPVEDFAEVWNWSKPIAGNAGWILSGIQQIN